MVTKKKAKNTRKTTSLQETIGDLIREAEEHLEVVRDQWNRYHHKEIKKGFKEARKAVLRVKKSCTEIRKAMANIEL